MLIMRNRATEERESKAKSGSDIRRVAEGSVEVRDGMQHSGMARPVSIHLDILALCEVFVRRR